MPKEQVFSISAPFLFDFFPEVIYMPLAMYLSQASFMKIVKVPSHNLPLHLYRPSDQSIKTHEHVIYNIRPTLDF